MFLACDANFTAHAPAQAPPSAAGFGSRKHQLKYIYVACYAILSLTQDFDSQDSAGFHETGILDYK